MKALILTEKPSQGRDMAEGLGEGFEKGEGCLISPSYIVTWAFGHLIELCAPEEYDEALREWKLDTLPFIPSCWKKKVIEKSAGQFKNIKNLLKRDDIDKVVEAGDPGREGELISRSILNFLDNKKPVFRFWVTMALDKKTVQQGMADLKPASCYDNLYKSADARQRGDWLVGMNATRVMSIKFGDTASVGRVQTPTLALIVKREKEINSFIPKDYWTVSAEFKHPDGVYIGRYANKEEEEERIETEEKEKTEDGNVYKLFEKSLAETAANSIKEKAGVITKVKTVTKSEPPPLLFSLTELQIACNKKYGITAEETLKIAQELYETDKAISYPRTESRHLSTNLAAEAPTILSKLSNVNIVRFAAVKTTVDVNNKRVFDDAKFTDHHAIIPTGNIPKSGSNKNKVYALICERFIAAFYSDFAYTYTVSYTKVNEYYFKSAGKAVISAGWREIHGGVPKDITMPCLKENDTVVVQKALLETKRTTPPDRYTESEILKSMENISRFVADEKYKKLLKETSGLGTPATRAEIIEKLKKRYLTVEKNKLIPNQKAILLIDTLKDSRIADPLFTAAMEQELEENPDLFMQNVTAYTREFVSWAKSLNVTPVEKKSKFPVVGVCPECGGEITAYEKLFGCKNNRKEEKTCGFILWRNGLEKLGKKSISDEEARKLLLKETVKTRFKSKAGKNYTADVKLVKEEKGYRCKVEFEKK